MTHFTRAEAARFLTENGYAISPATMAKQAVAGTGCPYRIWNGRAIYDTHDLLQWAQARLGPLLHSTAERTAAGRP